MPALRKRPQSAIVINRGGKTASYKGNSIVHTNADPDFKEIKTWFYRELAGVDRDPSEYRKAFHKFLDSPHRVIIETEANLVVAFDTARFAKFTNEAIMAGMAE